MMKKVIAGIAILVVALGAVWYFSAYRNLVVQRRALEKAEAYRTGEVIKSDKLDFVVIDAEKRSHLGGNGNILAIQPNSGNEYYVVNWAYANNTNQPLTMFNKPQIALENDNGKKVMPSLEAQDVFMKELKVNKNFHVELKPQAPVENGDVFVVKKDEMAKGNWYIVFKYDNNEYKIKA